MSRLLCGTIGVWLLLGAAQTPAKSINLDAVLATYVAGDRSIVSTTFTRSLDFQEALRLTEPKVLDRWLGDWNRGKATLLLDLAGQAVRVAPQYTAPLVLAGQRYLQRNRSAMAPSDAAFVRLWPRAAVGWLERIGNPDPIEAFLAAAGATPRGGKSAPDADARLVLAFAIAQEQRCWGIRPIDQPGSLADALGKDAGRAVRADLFLPNRSRRVESSVHQTCLAEAESRFAVASALADVRAEALTRGGWVRFQRGQFEPAREWLTSADPASDRELAYWTNLFRGRVADALGQPQASEAAYRAALAMYPAAQSASIGLALALMRLDRNVDADAAALGMRAAPGAPDPWSIYVQADHRFLDRWMTDLLRDSR